MLRNVLIGVGVAALLCGLGAIGTGLCPPGFVYAFWGAVLVSCLVFERVIYKRIETARPGAGWARTTERFVDEHSGQPVTVYIQPYSGERAYVRE